MNRTAPLEEKVGLLKVKNWTKNKEIVIEAIRLDGNSHYKYKLENGRTIHQRTDLTPDKFAELLAKKYEKKHMKGQIFWEYKNPNQKSYSLT